MLHIEDFEIKIKKYDRDKNQVIVNLIVCEELEIRGFIVRYTSTKYSTSPIWIVSPPSVKGRNRFYFWIVNLKNPTLWESLQKEIINLVKEYTNS